MDAWVGNHTVAVGCSDGIGLVCDGVRAGGVLSGVVLFEYLNKTKEFAEEFDRVLSTFQNNAAQFSSPGPEEAVKRLKACQMEMKVILDHVSSIKAGPNQPELRMAKMSMASKLTDFIMRDLTPLLQVNNHFVAAVLLSF